MLGHQACLARPLLYAHVRSKHRYTNILAVTQTPSESPQKKLQYKKEKRSTKAFKENENAARPLFRSWPKHLRGRPTQMQT